LTRSSVHFIKDSNHYHIINKHYLKEVVAVGLNIVEKAKEKYRGYENRHQEILDAAIHVFNEKGYKGATTAQIAREAGIVEPTMYKHFNNKKNLFLACFKSISEELMEEYQRVYKANKDDEAGYILGVAHVFFNFVRDNPTKSKFLVHLLSYRDDPDLDGVFRGFMKTSIDTVEKVIVSAQRKGIFADVADPQVLATLFICQYFTVIAFFEIVDADKIDEQVFYALLKSVLKIEK
jgi:AcrR family transcriptional regulator